MNTPWKRKRHELRKEHFGEASTATRCEPLRGPPAASDNVIADYNRPLLVTIDEFSGFKFKVMQKLLTWLRSSDGLAVQ